MYYVLKTFVQKKEFRKRFLLTIALLILCILGTQIPTPFVNTTYFKWMFQNQSSLGFLNVLTGNSLKDMSILALNITPYITSSIIMQLLAICVEPISKLYKLGAYGQKKIEKITIIFSIILAAIQSVGMAIGFGKQGMLTTYKWYTVLFVTVIWTLCAGLLALIGKYITDHGIGNGISMILCMNILSTMPSDVKSIYTNYISKYSIKKEILIISGVLLIIFIFLAFITLVNEAEKRIPVLYSQKVNGEVLSKEDSYIPIKMCISGVMPIIFASSIISFPVLIYQIIGNESNKVVNNIIKALTQTNWFSAKTPIYTLGFGFFILLIFVFSFFYASISFNTEEVANHLKKNGGIIPHVRPGNETVTYFNKKIKVMLVIGAFALALISAIPMIISNIMTITSLSFGGTSLLIIVSVIIETKKAFKGATYETKIKSQIKKGKV